MIDIERIESKVSNVPHGFTEMRAQATGIVKVSSVAESLDSAKLLYASDKYQVRMVAVFVFGYISPESKESVRILRNNVSKDASWQVQEILAQAFNEYCRGIGYENSLPIIKEWLGDKNPNVRRAVTEGLRIWNRRKYFRDHPQVAIEVLAALKDDQSEYVRRSVGNALRDISRKEKELIRKELSTWNLSDPNVKFTHDLAGRFI